MSRTAKGSGFKMKSGNSPLFKEMGSSPLQAGDAGIIAAATPETSTIAPIDFTIKTPEIKIGKTKKKKGGNDNDEEEEEEEENNEGDDGGGEDKSE